VSGPLVVVGDALLDRDVDGRVERLAPDAPVPVVDDPVERARPGGAALAAALAAADGREVVLVTALAGDGPADELRALLAAWGVEVVDLGLDGRTPEKVRVRAGDQPIVRLDRGGPPGVVGPAGAGARRALAGAAAVLVADYGRGVAAEPTVRAALAAALRRVPTVWDPHPRGPEPVPGIRLATPNRAEAERLVPDVEGGGLAAVTARAEQLVARWGAGGVAVTLGAGGALLVAAGSLPLAVPAVPATGGDPCGAGDRFAAAAATALADGALPSEAVTTAVRLASQFVAAGGAAAVRSPAEGGAPLAGGPGDDAEAVVRRVRAAGGTVVATGGCFDLLHAGHVHVLQAARRLGDCLVVCLNSDASVTRLKGPGRPLVPAGDRAAVLEALTSVDAVVVFEEDTPEAVLERLRPDVWAKGADYSVDQLPEARLLARWGGRAVVLPYLQGRSTSSLVQEVERRAHP
jgi:rfaE bifunctional protein nucleotidyltransferase chain/domain/rfaE bifunctional protein kinase chain/domain